MKKASHPNSLMPELRRMREKSAEKDEDTAL